MSGNGTSAAPEYAPGQGSMRRTVYNHSGQEVGEIIKGKMFAVPAGMPGGGPGTLVCNDRVARLLVERRPQELTLSAGCYGEAEVQQMRALPLEALQALALELMRGSTPRIEDVVVRFAAAQADTRPARPGSPARE